MGALQYLGKGINRLFDNVTALKVQNKHETLRQLQLLLSGLLQQRTEVARQRFRTQFLIWLSNTIVSKLPLTKQPRQTLLQPSKLRQMSEPLWLRAPAIS